MCTLTFVPEGSRFRLAMNRDESLARPAALPPRVVSLTGTAAVYPHEAGGGTWIGANEHGIACALLNWHVPAARPMLRTRGEVIPALLAGPGQRVVEQMMESMDLHDIRPFRLVVAYSREQRLSEWRWNGTQLELIPWDWRPRHWFSSGASDAEVERQRRLVCDLAWSQPEAGSLEWMRALHSSHRPNPGPFSICVHRAGVGSVSYTEVALNDASLEMHYAPGPPCQSLIGNPTFFAATLPIHQPA